MWEAAMLWETKALKGEAPGGEGEMPRSTEVSEVAILEMDPPVSATLADDTSGEPCSCALPAFLTHKSWAK